MANKGEGKASALLKTMDRGSPRQQPEELGSEALMEAKSTTSERAQKTVRLTVDLDPARHRRIKNFAHAEDTKSTAVMRALLDELNDDPELAARIRERLARRA